MGEKASLTAWYHRHQTNNHKVAWHQLTPQDRTLVWLYRQLFYFHHGIFQLTLTTQKTQLPLPDKGKKEWKTTYSNLSSYINRTCKSHIIFITSTTLILLFTWVGGTWQLLWRFKIYSLEAARFRVQSLILSLAAWTNEIFNFLNNLISA